MHILASAVFDLVDRIAASSTVMSVWDAYLGAARHVALQYAAAVYMAPAGQPVIVAHNFPSDWLQTYHDQNLAEGDLLLRRNLDSPTSFHWRMSDWDRATLTPIQRLWYDHNIESGILGGMTIKDARRGDGMVLVVCGHDGALDANDRLGLIFSGQEAMVRLRELAVDAPLEFAPLSRRERECLQWAAAGKTDWEIGQILSLSEKTVNVYVERAKTKFQVTTRAQAVALAVKAGLIAA